MRKLGTWPETLGRSVFVGAIVGASCVTGYFLVSFSGAIVLGGVEGVLGGAYFIFFCFAYAFLFWLMGLVILGFGPWWLLHQLGFRGRLAAAVLGFSLPASLWWFDGKSPVICAGMGVTGVLVAEAIWNSAYKHGAGADGIRAP